MKTIKDMISEAHASKYINPIEGVDWEKPNEEGVKLIQKWLEENKLMPHGKLFPNKYMKTQDWLVYLASYDGDKFYALGYDCVIQRPYKKRDEHRNRILEFREKSLIASARGGLILYPNEDEESYNIINPIADALGMKYNKDGEFLAPGEKSGWSR